MLSCGRETWRSGAREANTCVTDVCRRERGRRVIMKGRREKEGGKEEEVMVAVCTLPTTIITCLTPFHHNER